MGISTGNLDAVVRVLTGGWTAGAVGPQKLTRLGLQGFNPRPQDGTGVRSLRSPRMPMKEIVTSSLKRENAAEVLFDWRRPAKRLKV